MSDYFPPEVIVEILHRLPLKSLVKCISVCKSWKSLITHQPFISDHLTHTLTSNNGHSSFFLQLYSEMRTESPMIYTYWDTLSLYSDNKQIDDRLSILTHPCPQHFFQNDYSTMVGTCNGLSDLSLSTMNTLQKLRFSLLLLLPNVAARRPPQMFLNGAIHWVVKRRSNINGQVHNFILSFDVAEET
ncbi:F-box/kelch-repeat protein [Senna tora]|uniref:F-box/kelch-repeat protein n=1 Tax=Senna tora TaxID=362788 RepID=A0A835CJA0_9FABA|nr:F-box/kelch-repeat protein [Senna tora]